MTLTTPAYLDQIFVLTKHALLAYAPAPVQPLVSAILSVIPVLIAFPLLFAITTVLERKGLGRIQNRYGPNRVGPFGFFQPIADGIKSLTKEDIIPTSADHAVHLLAPIVLGGDPTLLGLDSDDERCLGEVGRTGVAIDTMSTEGSANASRMSRPRRSASSSAPSISHIPRSPSSTSRRRSRPCAR